MGPYENNPTYLGYLGYLVSLLGPTIDLHGGRIRRRCVRSMTYFDINCWNRIFVYRDVLYIVGGTRPTPCPPEINTHGTQD